MSLALSIFYIPKLLQHVLLWFSFTYFPQIAHVHDCSSILDIKDEVHEAIINNRPVVALESTIITHGMPRPQNLETAIEVENIVREQVMEFNYEAMNDSGEC